MRALLRDIGVMEYGACWIQQQEIFDAILYSKRAAEGKVVAQDEAACSENYNKDDVGTIILVEHPPVYTLGKNGVLENMLIESPAIKALGASFFHIDRGGDVTFHGEGQIVGYPILDLERVGIGLKEYIAALEEAVIRTVATWGIEGKRVEGASGVWIVGASGAEAKICAIGVRSSRYVTMHGFALNVNTDLKWFDHINPCGFTNKGVTSIAKEVGKEVSMEDSKRLVIKFLSEILNVKIYK